MKGESSSGHRKQPSPLFSKTAREWMLSSALYDGIEDEDIRQIEMLLAERGANPNTLLPEYGIAPFHMVVANDSTRFAVQATDICLQHGADPNVRSEDGLTPVHLAAMWGCPEVLQVLLASGGDPWLVDCFDMNAFNYALKEDQEECYEILKTCCNSQPKPSSHSKSPYHLNLKRVILYKNDLQIVYEASPSSSQKNTSTQTSPTLLKDEPEKDSQSKSFENKTPKSINAIKKANDIESPNNVSNFPRKSRRVGTDTHKDNEEECRTDSSYPYDRSILSSRLKEAIVNHRRNSITFEYSPSTEDTDKISVGAKSCEESNVENISVMSNIVSELIKKLENTNKLRQSLKVNACQNDVLKNVTQRKKPLQVPCSRNENDVMPRRESNHSSLSNSEFVSINGDISKDDKSLTEKSSKQPLHQNEIGFVLNSSSKLLVDESSLYTLPENEIGFVLNDSFASSTILLRRNKTAPESNPASPPSIGFILDNLDETTPNTRGSSLFSDIDSDVGSPALNVNDDNIYTEDESVLSHSHQNKCSPSESLDPYVSCVTEDTREWGSKEEHFESCIDTLPQNEESVFSNSHNSKFKKCTSGIVHCDMDNDNKETPVNPNVVTSTPERLSAGGSVFVFPTEKDSKTEKRSWVEATLLSSSDDDELFMSISEEYEYTDMDEGVVLIEKHYLKKDFNIESDSKKTNPSEMPSSASELSDVSTISGSEGAYDTDELRRGLKAHGFTPGPINGSTKRVYLRKLKRFRRKPEPLPRNGEPAYSPVLLGTLNATCDHKLIEWAYLEDSMAASFACGRRPWREGNSKTSFTYLLLDPRIAQSLPARANKEPHSQLWSDFLQGVFYVGKGKRSRPYAHLYSAVAFWKQQQYTNSKKIQRILDVWKSGQGVVCLHVFLNIIPVEALTREAAMISALTLAPLTNEKAGEFYGSASCWNLRLKQRLGCVLLHRAFKVFLAEGERQLRPADID